MHSIRYVSDPGAVRTKARILGAYRKHWHTALLMNRVRTGVIDSSAANGPLGFHHSSATAENLAISASSLVAPEVEAKPWDASLQQNACQYRDMKSDYQLLRCLDCLTGGTQQAQLELEFKYSRCTLLKSFQP